MRCDRIARGVTGGLSAYMRLLFGSGSLAGSSSKDGLEASDEVGIFGDQVDERTFTIKDALGNRKRRNAV